jgi:hypothetical protein
MPNQRLFLTSESTAIDAHHVGGAYMSTTQYNPQGFVWDTIFMTPTTADIVNRYGDYFTRNFNSATPAPASIAGGSGAILPLSTWFGKTPYTGKYDAGQWTIVVGNRWNVGRPAVTNETMSMHLRAQLWAAPNLLYSSAPYRQISSVKIGPVVAFPRSEDVGLFPVTFNLDEVTLNNEHLVLVVAYQLDSVLVNAVGGTDTYSPILDTTSYVDTPFFHSSAPVQEPCGVPGLRSAERYSYITPAGVEYPLDVPKSRAVISSEGEGLPPINFLTQRGPFQDGVTMVDEFLQPRIVQLIIRHTYRSRNAYTAGRQALVGVLDPRLQTVEGTHQLGTLRKYLMSGDRRDLLCMPIQGPNFNPRGTEWDEWSYQETLRFQGFDPTYTNPVQHSQAFAKQGDQLVGPMTGPIIGTTLDSIISVAYGGTWRTYPIITVLGPALGVLLENRTTSEKLFINYPLQAGQTMIISLVQGAKTVTLDDGTNLIGYVSTDSDLTSWHLTENNGGVNILHARGSGVNSNTLVTMDWYDKYLGI